MTKSLFMASSTAQTEPRKRLHPEERREQLLEAAIEQFARQGIGETKHADIARAVGITTAATFKYFPTRDALVTDVIDAVSAFVLSLFDGVEPVKGGAAAILRALAGKALTLVDTHPYHVQVWLGWSTRFDPDMRARYRLFEEELLSRISHILWAGDEKFCRDNRDDARILMAASLTLCIMKLDGEPPEKLARFTEHTIDVVMAYGRDDTG